MERQRERWYPAPDIQKAATWWDEFFLFLWGSVGLVMTSSVTKAILDALPSESAAQKSMTLNLASYLVIFAGYLLYAFLARPKIGRILIEGFKRDHAGKILDGWLIFLGSLAVANLYLLAVSLGVFQGNLQGNNNQQSIEQMKAYAFPLALVTLILGPICEEMAYRVGLCSLLERWSGWGAILITGAVFGFLHFDFSTIPPALSGNGEALSKELWIIPSYLVMGFGLGYAYVRNGCLSSTLVGHVWNNLISVVEMYA